MSRKPIRYASFTAASFLWGAVVVYGGHLLLRYENTTGTPGKPPASWPSASQMIRPADRHVLVMMAHPDCPCTRASLTELQQLMHGLEGKLVAFVVFRKPGANTNEVKRSELWNRAAGIPGVTVLQDLSGVETAQFGSQVSGQTMLYDLRGRLVFSGGITAARGREGYSAGQDAVIRAVSHPNGVFVHTAIFGCSLNDPGPQELKEESSWKKHRRRD